MDVRREFERRIERKRQEIVDAERGIAEATAYIQALMDALKILPKDKEEGVEKPLAKLRSGSDLALVADLIKTKARPLHIDEILTGIGKPMTKESKTSLSTSLGAYARRNIIFTKPMPNTFGLLSLAEPSASSESRITTEISENLEEPPF